jgi:Zn-dependent protease
MGIDLEYIIIVVGVIFVSMTIHEVMHGLVAYYLGDDTAKAQGRLTLNPIKHIDPFLTILLPVLLAISGAPIFGGAKPVPFNPNRLRYGEWGVALVAVSGPIINLLIAFVAFGLLAVFNLGQETPAGNILSITTMVNLGFFVFNMLPLPPLDGSRVLYALAPDFVRRGMEAIERFGLLLIIGVVLIFSSVLGTFMVVAINAILKVFMAIFGVSTGV